MILNFGVLVVGVLLFRLVLSGHPSPRLWTSWQIVGFAIALPAFLLFVVAHVQLGRAFSVRAKASRLVTTGLYARIRHPIYVFAGLWVAGLILFVERPWWMLIFAVLIPVQLLRVRKEERVLEAKFGDAYRGYRRQTWF